MLSAVDNLVIIGVSTLSPHLSPLKGQMFFEKVKFRQIKFNFSCQELERERSFQ